MPTSHVIVIEPFAPHTFLTVRWAQALHAAGADVTTVTFPEVNETGIVSSPIKPWDPLPAPRIPRALRGRFNPASRLVVLWEFRAHAAKVRATIEQLIETHPATHIVISTSFPTDLLGLAQIAGPTRILAVVHGAPIDGRMARVALRRYAGSGATSDRHWLGCLTEEMREPFIAAGCGPERVVVAPAAWTTFESRASESTPEGPVMFAGEAREEKGFGFFVRATRSLLRYGRVRLQTYNLGLVNRETCDLIDELTAEKDDRLELVESRLSNEAYERMIGDSAMVAIPYDPLAYPSGRISQILSEAWAAGVPVIASEGWWASRIIAQFGGGALFKYGDIDSMIAAATRVRADHAGMCERARRGHAEMLRDAGPDAFAKFVLGL